MNYDTALIEAELAAYSPVQLADLAGTISILLDAADDGSTHYASTRQRIEDRLATATNARMVAKRKAGQTSTIVPFPGKPK
jgi:hypothetical protein